ESFTVAYWAWLNTYQNPVIANKRTPDDSSNAWQVNIASFGAPEQNVQLCLYSASVCVYSPEISPTPVGRWTHVPATYDGVTMNLYADGVLLSSTLGSSSPQDGTADILLGDWVNGGYDFDGLLDEVRIYDDALTASDVEALAALQPDCDADGVE